MAQYLLLIHGNANREATMAEWESFFSAAEASGHFRGGSELGERSLLGEADSVLSTDHIVGFMRFEAEDRDSLLALLKTHPVVLHGGTIELCEMPLSSPPE